MKKSFWFGVVLLAPELRSCKAMCDAAVLVRTTWVRLAAKMLKRFIIWNTVN